MRMPKGLWPGTAFGAHHRWGGSWLDPDQQGHPLKRFSNPLGKPDQGNLITALVDNLGKAKEILKRYKIEKTASVDENYILKGLITIKDIEKVKIWQPRIPAAYGWQRRYCRRYHERVGCPGGAVSTLSSTAHGHSGSTGMVRRLRASTRAPAAAGNVAMAEAPDLIQAGADGLRWRVLVPSALPGSSVDGVPQITAVLDCTQEAAKADVPAMPMGDRIRGY